MLVTSYKTTTILPEVLPLALTFVLYQVVLFAMCVVIVGWFVSCSKR